jgi:hypothetical protein
MKHGYSKNGEVHVPGTHQYRVRIWYLLVHIYKSKYIFIWLIQDGGYSKNVHLVEKYHKTFSFFYYILIIYLTFDENS